MISLFPVKEGDVLTPWETLRPSPPTPLRLCVRVLPPLPPPRSKHESRLFFPCSFICKSVQNYTVCFYPFRELEREKRGLRQNRPEPRAGRTCCHCGTPSLNSDRQRDIPLDIPFRRRREKLTGLLYAVSPHSPVRIRDPRAQPCPSRI
jgi:hypothetical protein